jgi:aspartyl-tRNA(Asn)/glutamyl-tRNA(Gln) amidotransferase subunit C
MISEDEVQKIATLARLEIGPSFKPVITAHLNSIIGYVQRLNEVDTTGVQAMSHVQGATNILRDDFVGQVGSNPPAMPLCDPAIPVQEMLSPEGLLQNVPDHSGRFIRVPLIVE